MTAASDGEPLETWERTSFSGAASKYAALVEEERRTGFPVAEDGLSRHDVPYGVTRAELQAFGINPELAGALFWAYCRYECLVGTTTEYFFEFLDEERDEFGAFYDDSQGERFEHAVAFMNAACDLPLAQCMAWVLKVWAADVRGGLYGPELL